MKRFTQLYAEIDSSTKTTEKVAAMERYFRVAPPEDAAWTVALLSGRRPKRIVNSTKMQIFAIECAGIAPWLFSECYSAVGDLAETIALVIEGTEREDEEPPALHLWMTKLIPELGRATEDEQRALLHRYWSELGSAERFVLNKLIGGAFRVGVSQDLVVRALGQACGQSSAIIAHRLMGAWEPTSDFFATLIAEEDGDALESRPYPFCLAHPLQTSIAELRAIEDWFVEWKWDGIRTQLVKRNGSVYVWSRGEELIGERFPEIAMIGRFLPDGTVLDGEILAWKDGLPLPFLELQRRIGRKTVGKKLMDEVPVRLLAFDVLEFQGEDLRERSLEYRRSVLEQMVEGGVTGLQPSELVEAESWEALAELRMEARSRFVEGLMLKRRDSVYAVGRKKGAWWKWKVDPFTVDAVLVYAARGSGKRASLYTDYTFAVWDEGQLVPFAKAYSGLTDAEIAKVDAWIRRHTVEKFGPVRTVAPELVFELAFEGIQLSKRHKSGVAVRFPRILRWRHDKRADQADHLAQVKESLLRVNA